MMLKFQIDEQHHLRDLLKIIFLSEILRILFNFSVFIKKYQTA
ncbi:hypothetical protein PEDI_03210 [Persicobacter diffluens]|uniref:Uncharacterized protein n=1 Tax=Persicobacter diffluens TaxID=981 RepID=A0AAN5AIC8_9BACT|nr:hypothetical protein PEDI_03210 [Persicobacter diffluens]